MEQEITEAKQEECPKWDKSGLVCEREISDP